jgi:hypothetical protein
MEFRKKNFLFSRKLKMSGVVRMLWKPDINKVFMQQPITNGKRGIMKRRVGSFARAMQTRKKRHQSYIYNLDLKSKNLPSRNNLIQ